MRAQGRRQLNCLIISGINGDDISFTSYDRFPVRTVLKAQAEGGRSYYIRWGDSRVQVLERGAEFSHCRHVRTGYEMDILTKYLFEPGSLPTATTAPIMSCHCARAIR